jgi:hypothetical protein
LDVVSLSSSAWHESEDLYNFNVQQKLTDQRRNPRMFCSVLAVTGANFLTDRFAKSVKNAPREVQWE